MKLVIALATRGRPALLVDTLARTLPLITEDKTQLIVMADADDGETIAAVRQQFEANAERIILNVHEREDTVAEKFNRALKFPADVYTAMVDHTHFETKGFDCKIIEAAALHTDGIGFVFNHFANMSFVGNYSWTRKAADMLGYLFPPYFPYWFIDHWVHDIALMVDRISFADVVTNSERKQVTQEMREPAWWANWYDAAYMLRRKVALKIIESPEFKEPYAHKERWLNPMAAARWGRIEQGSVLINNDVRDRMVGNLSPDDARYQRVKQKAIAMLPELLAAMPAWQAMHYRNALTPLTAMPALKRAYA